MGSSKLMPGERVINDESPSHYHAEPRGMRRGLDLSLRSADGYGDAAEPFPRELLVPRSEWQARIQEIEASKSRLSDLATLAGLPPKNQQQTNYCWINAPTYCTEMVRVVQNQPLVLLSPASAGAQIKNYQNVGGWGKEGLEWIIAHGLVPVDRWPANAIDRRYATAENKALALKYRVAEWWELTPGNVDEFISCLLRRIPIAVGYNWWSHEVSMIDPLWLDGDVAVRIRNSWGDWGENGYGVLQGQRMLPDDAVAPRTALAA